MRTGGTNMFSLGALQGFCSYNFPFITVIISVAIQQVT